MRKIVAFVAVIVLVVFTSGCLRTYSFKKERVDQEIAGNRGTIMGDAPPAQAKETPTDRTIIGVDVELPFFTGFKKKQSAREAREVTTDKELWGNRGYMSGETAPSQTAYPYSAERVEKVKVVEERVEEKPSFFEQFKMEKKKPDFTEYKVRKGDTLSTIAARSDIYGDAGKWKKIYEANKETIKNPSRVYPGQVLRIPMLEEETRKGSRVK